MRSASLAFVLFVCIFAACRYVGGKRINGNGKIIVEQRNLDGFDGVRVTGPFDILLAQGTHAVKIEGDENLMEYIETEVDGASLRIINKKGYNLRPRQSIKVHITAPNFKEIAIVGSGRVHSQAVLTGVNEMAFSVTGSGEIKTRVDAPQVHSKISGSGSIELMGKTRDFEGRIMGSGELHAFELLSESADINISGSGDAEVFASKNLNLRIAGSGNVDYKGNPAVKKNIASSGNINKVE